MQQGPELRPFEHAARVREVLSDNLCRRTDYIPIIEAVLDARAAHQKKDEPGA